jgi:hypothetical protein
LTPWRASPNWRALPRIYKRGFKYEVHRLKSGWAKSK